MNEENFKKGIKELIDIRMTDAEKENVLAKVFASPIKSPFMRRSPVFAFIYSQTVRTVVMSSFIFILSFSGLVYASEKSLPGDLFYPVKTKFVEPVFDVVNAVPEKKIVWEVKKVTRRILEAEQLAERDQLDDKSVEELERSIEKSSISFTIAADAVASSTGTTATARKEKASDLKRKFRERINERMEMATREAGNGSGESGESDQKLESSSEIRIEIEQSIQFEDNTKVEIKSSDKDKQRSDQKDKIRRLENAVIKILDKSEEESEDRSRDIDRDESSESRDDDDDESEKSLNIDIN